MINPMFDCKAERHLNKTVTNHVMYADNNLLNGAQRNFSTKKC